MVTFRVPVVIGRPLACALTWFLGVFLGKWMMGYEGSYEEYYVEKMKKGIRRLPMPDLLSHMTEHQTIRYSNAGSDTWNQTEGRDVSKTSPHSGIGSTMRRRLCYL